LYTEDAMRHTRYDCNFGCPVEACLEDDGIVARKVYAEMPPKVEYSLTEFGQTLEDLLRNLQRWGSDSLETIIRIKSKGRDRHRTKPI
jgi:DNA-binding HxlR family transcriptional regulator